MIQLFFFPDSPRDGGADVGGPGLPKITDPKTGIDLSELIKEMRRLRVQLERSIDTNNALRSRLEELMRDRNWSPNMEYKYSHITMKDTVTENNRTTRNSKLSRRLFVNTGSFHGWGRKCPSLKIGDVMIVCVSHYLSFMCVCSGYSSWFSIFCWSLMPQNGSSTRWAPLNPRYTTACSSVKLNAGNSRVRKRKKVSLFSNCVRKTETSSWYQFMIIGSDK